MDSLFRTVFPLLVPALLATGGCSRPGTLDSAEITRLRTELTLAEEPDNVQTVSEVRMALLGEAAPDVLELIEPAGAAPADADAHEGHGHDAESEADAEHDGAEPAGDVAANTAAPNADGDHADAGHADHDADGDHAGHDHAEHGHAGHGHAEHGHSHEGEAHSHAPTGKTLDVAIVGVVGGVPNPSKQLFADFPFDADHAMLFVADPEAVAELQEHGHQHAPGEECAFGAAHADDATGLLAAVSFKDAQGNVLPIDVRTLLGVKEKDTVVITGKAYVAPGDIITVDATGLYVRE
ncbi:MAG TPA: hypothetical protein VEQ85_13465 [Lacipirellulaceae bacterium]|nr:hypothetical protein [Lacipirellulaceae bacterium]